MDQGVLRKIGQLFIAPLLHYRPAKVSLEEFMTSFFHMDERFIFRLRAKHEATMPGRFKLTAQRTSLTKGNRSIRPGDDIFLRWDMTEPENLELELLRRTKGFSATVFIVPAEQFVTDLIGNLKHAGKGLPQYESFLTRLRDSVRRAQLQREGL